MASVRQTSVAGTFYPADPDRLRGSVEEMLAESEGATVPAPRALIVPHAGYLYSGPIAANAFKLLEAPAQPIHRVVVVGPSHFVPFAGVALPEATAFETPLGEIVLDVASLEQVRELESVVTWDEPHRREHCIEVELPFLQTVLGSFGLVPLVTGDATGEQIARILDDLWDDDTLVVISSDLSHYHGYDDARRLDARTAAAITDGRQQDLAEGSACGRLAIQGLMIAAQRRGHEISLVDLRNSGDTNGPREEVVGYGAFCAG